MDERWKVSIHGSRCGRQMQQHPLTEMPLADTAASIVGDPLFSPPPLVWSLSWASHFALVLSLASASDPLRGHEIIAGKKTIKLICILL